jgi:hypothetical protein
MLSSIGGEGFQVRHVVVGLLGGQPCNALAHRNAELFVTADNGPFFLQQVGRATKPVLSLGIVELRLGGGP